MGNLLIALPHLKAMLDQHRDALLVFDDSYRAIVEASLPGETRLLGYPGAALGSGQPLLKRARHYLRFVFAMRRFRPTLCIDVEGEQKSATLARLSGARQRRGPARPHSRWFYTENLSRENHGHRWQGYASLSDPAAPPPARYLPAQTDEPARTQLATIIEEGGLTAAAPWLVIHVGATKYYKMWHPQQFALLCQRARQAGLEPILIGAGRKDRQQVEQVQASLKTPALDLCDRLTLKQLIALFHGSRAYVGNDSGPMHLAAACGLPTVGLFGPTDERLWQPMADQARILRWQDCDPDCQRSHCALEHYPCLQRISVEQVMTTLAELGAVPAGGHRLADTSA
ncbi:glycosyltransferase family 9 protein [Alcanivorax hongdengensis]|nr:glycosyltransferase family 9 protein [Alcanivorax hongdengensis]